MAKSLHETYHVRQPDYIPEGQEHLHPHLGGVFCDFVPEGMTAIDIKPTADADGVSTAPIPGFEEALPVTDEQIETFTEEMLDAFAPSKPKKK